MLLGQPGPGTTSPSAKAYEDRTPMPKDATLALRCYLRSALAGHPLGQVCAGLAYNTGTGSTADRMAAQAWWLPHPRVTLIGTQHGE